ncbi:MAG: TetR/AcrR family transcriptional regulator [Chloroflexi bacterium]|nr:TetR/AcrR family transcriptional regulator [Chloroflexota bacterium]
MTQDNSPVSGDLSSGGPVRLRDQHHAVTRLAILRAGRELFAERGYAQASVKGIAARAGVAIQTIYDAFGSKAGIVRALVDVLDQEAGVLDAWQELPRLDDPVQILRVFARIRRQIRERCGDIVRTMRSGAATHPEMAAVLAEGMRRRHSGLSRIMSRLATVGALKDGLTAERAADIAAAVVVDEVCDVLVEQRSWTFDEYEEWLGDTLVALLLRRDTVLGRRDGATLD